MFDLEDIRLDLVVMGLLLVVLAGAVTDLILDAPRRWFTAHVVLEVGLAIVSGGGALYLARGWYLTRRSLGSLRGDLAVRQARRESWHAAARAALEGLALEVDRQFTEWNLTPAEREIALMLLKGFSLAQIARLTDRSERTARQHAIAVYRKAGLAGRAELAGFFLGDLLLPTPGLRPPSGP
ncbi:MAG: helix-turn-helix transcriptional regulator [Gemmatimonadota bacterium]|nr:helix-turn-helix transcriptional regulator [Gemmatimonadota bacterium]